LAGGVGTGVVVLTRGDTNTSRVYHARTGQYLATWSTPDQQPRFGAVIGAAAGPITQRMHDSDGPYPRMHITALDPCSRTRWTITPERPQWPVLLLPGDELLVAERDDVEDSEIAVTRYSAAGERMAGPTPAAAPWLAGSDGTIYGLACDTDGHEGPSRLIAYSPELVELWRLELGPSCPSGGPALADDGTLYFTWYAERATELVAVQTHSPGPADSSWPMRQRDNRNTGWLRGP
ncbi:MAG: hypothetical protein AAGC55_29760, partial [Myxococcota bacterium]